MKHETSPDDTVSKMINAGRLVSFSDGVIAVIITILVLEIKIPTGDKLTDLKPLIPVLLAYLLSFRQIGTYWNNHHHLMALAHKVNTRLMWSNLNFLFCISLIPFATAWVGAHHNASGPVAFYGGISLLCGIAYNRLQAAILAVYAETVVRTSHFDKDVKGKLSLLCYSLGILLAFVNTWLAIALYVTVAIIWFVPERRIVEIKPDATL